MKTFSFKPQNMFMHKIFKIEPKSSNIQKVYVQSSMLGNWDFLLENISYEDLSEKLTVYCQCDKLLQEVFSNLTLDTKLS